MGAVLLACMMPCGRARGSVNDIEHEKSGLSKHYGGRAQIGACRRFASPLSRGHPMSAFASYS